MKNVKYQVVTDFLAMIFTLSAIVTGFILHNEVWHLHVYDNTTLWCIHEIAGLALVVLAVVHCIQHSFWFKHYFKINVTKKRVTTILLLIGIVVAVTGVILMCGSRSELVSHIHYAGAILFTLIAIGHVVKRWKLLKALI